MQAVFRKAIDDLTRNYPGFSAEEPQDGSVIVNGIFSMDAEWNGIRLAEDFGLEMRVGDDYPETVPIVKETTCIIPSSYEHMYEDRSFCLGINGELALGLRDNPSLVAFLEGPVQSYLYTALFHCRYGKYPYGEWSHDRKGILEYYSNLFKTDDQGLIEKLLAFIAGGKYRGHLPCPCGSRTRLRYCHGPMLFELVTSSAQKEIARDYKVLFQSSGKLAR